MTTPDLLTAFDRCQRLAFHSLTWEPWKRSPTDVLKTGIDAGLTEESPDAGIHASDFVMDFAAHRGLETPQFEVFQVGLHHAALADIVTGTLLSRFGGWFKPLDVATGKDPWVSGCFLNGQGTRLRRYVLVSNWNDNRAAGEHYGWNTLGECSIYNMPMDLYVVSIGQFRNGRRHSPWSKGWTHPRSHQLRLRKRSGDGFDGNWESVWREDREEFSRSKWVDAMESDDVLRDCLTQIEIPVPPSNLRQEMCDLAARNLDRLAEMKEAPGKAPSQCFWPSRCPFTQACWFGARLDGSGFTKIHSL